MVTRTFCADPDFRCETHSEPKSESAPDRRVTIWVAAEVVVTEMAIRVPLRNVAVRLRALLQPVLAHVSTVRLVLAPKVVLSVSGHRLTAAQVLARIRQDRLNLRLEQIELLHFDEVFLRLSIFLMVTREVSENRPERTKRMPGRFDKNRKRFLILQRRSQTSSKSVPLW